MIRSQFPSKRAALLFASVFSFTSGCASFRDSRDPSDNQRKSYPVIQNHNPFQILRLDHIERKLDRMQFCYYKSDTDPTGVPAGVSIVSAQCPNQVKYNFSSNTWVPLIGERELQ